MKFKVFLKRFVQSILYAIRNFFSLFLKLQEVSILTYHSISDASDETTVSVAALEKQINFLKQNGYYFATLAEIVSYVKGEETTLPFKVVAFTIDDGYEDSYTNAFPLFKKYKIPVTIFIVKNFEMMKQPRKANLPNLSIQQRKEMEISELVDFQSHSQTHAMLDNISDAKLRQEVEKGGYLYFAYPGGHHNQTVREAVKQAGYTAAFTIRPGLVKSGDNLFAMRRNVILGNISLFDFKVRVTKTIDWYTKLTHALK